MAVGLARREKNVLFAVELGQKMVELENEIHVLVAESVKVLRKKEPEYPCPSNRRVAGSQGIQCAQGIK